MNWDQLAGKWRQIKGEARVKWGKLTDDDLELIGGHKDKLIGLLQERYGIAREQAEREADEWMTNLDVSNEKYRQEKQREREPKVRHSAR